MEEILEVLKSIDGKLGFLITSQSETLNQILVETINIRKDIVKAGDDIVVEGIKTQTEILKASDEILKVNSTILAEVINTQTEIIKSKI